MKRRFMTVKLMESWFDSADNKGSNVLEHKAKVVSLNFKKQTVRLNWKNRFGKSQTKDFPIDYFYGAYEIYPL